MTEETKKLFDAPWRATILDYVEDANGYYVCECGTHLTASNIARLPELYDALNKQAYYRCVDCLRHTANTIDDIPLNRDMIEHGCPKNRTDCGAFDAWKLLRKVRDGK